MKRQIIIGTRGSQLALWQANHVKSLIEATGGCEVCLEIIKTKGDKILDVPLAKVGGKGLFVKEIEDALLRKDIDLAVHSMKDVPTELPDNLGIVAILPRENPYDIFVSGRYASLEELPAGARVGTSSLRRQCQLLNLYPELKIEFLRGNLDTRVKKGETGEFDGVILAAAGMHRMGWKERITSYIDPESFVPAVAQGAIGIETRLDDTETRTLIESFHHEASGHEVEAERAFLKTLEGGCQVPIGAHAVYDKERESLSLVGLIGEPDGSLLLKKKITSPVEAGADAGTRLARELLNLGGREILERVYAGGKHE